MGVSLRTFRWWKAHEGLPFHRLPGGKTLYSTDELDAWLRWRDVIDPPRGAPPPRIPRYDRRRRSVKPLTPVRAPAGPYRAGGQPRAGVTPASTEAAE
jgi:hypothetical protein